MYTIEEIKKMGPIADLEMDPEHDYYSQTLGETIKQDVRERDILITFLTTYIGGIVPQEVIKYVFEDPLTEMVKYIGSPLVSMRIASKWRLTIGK